MYDPNGGVEYQMPFYKWTGGFDPGPRQDIELACRLWHVSRTRLTARLIEAQCAQVKRIYELEETPCDRPNWEPPCCYGCSWNILHDEYPTDPYHVPSSYDRAKFPNVWLCRLLIMSRAYNQDHLMDDYAELDPEDLWDTLMLRFVTCSEPRVCRLGDDFEVDPEPDYQVGFWGGPGFDLEWDAGSADEPWECMSDDDEEGEGIPDEQQD